MCFRDIDRNVEVIVPENRSVLGFLFQFYHNESQAPEIIFSVDIVFKVRLFVDQRLTYGGIKDIVAIHLFFSQMLHEYLQGNVRCRVIQDIVDLASLVMFAKFGRCPSDRNEAGAMLVENIHHIIPDNFLHEFDYVDCFYERNNCADADDENIFRNCRLALEQKDEYSCGALTHSESPTIRSVLFPKELIDGDSFTSGTWFLESVDVSSDWGSGWLCYKIRRAWNQIDISFTSCNQAGNFQVSLILSMKSNILT